MGTGKAGGGSTHVLKWSNHLCSLWLGLRVQTTGPWAARSTQKEILAVGEAEVCQHTGSQAIVHTEWAGPCRDGRALTFNSSQQMGYMSCRVH